MPSDIRDSAVPARQRLVWRTLIDALDLPGRRILDCGGGSGTFAVPLALHGAEVTVLDISADALATLQRRAAEAGVAERIIAVQGDVETLPEAVTPAFDLVLAHGILEAVAPVESVFASMVAMTKPGGLISVLVTNPVAAVLARALAGDLEAALDEFRAIDAPERIGPATVERLCLAAGLAVQAVHGVGVFSELVPGAALDRPGAAELLLELEASTAARAPFAEIASRVHTLARVPG